MKYVKSYQINEIHPGARSADETIQRFIDRAEQNGISYDTSRRAISIYIDFIKGREIPEIKMGSELAEALINIENCVRTLFDDGYPTDWIARELLHFT
jgi:hypothetical protein